MAAFVTLDRAIAVAATGDHQDRSLITQDSPDAVRIIATVGDDTLHADRLADQQISPFHIRGVAGRQDEAKSSPEDIDKRVDLGRSAPARYANGICPPPLWMARP